jgi:hypothetical protein
LRNATNFANAARTTHRRRHAAGLPGLSDAPAAATTV